MLFLFAPFEVPTAKEVAIAVVVQEQQQQQEEEEAEEDGCRTGIAAVAPLEKDSKNSCHPHEAVEEANRHRDIDAEMIVSEKLIVFFKHGEGQKKTLLQASLLFCLNIL